MQQITLTLDLTPENLQLLAGLIGTTLLEPRDETKSGTKKKNAQKTAQNKPVEEIAKDDAQNVIEETSSETPTPAESVSKTDVRALALKLSKSGKQDTIKEIFTKFNADKLSDIKEEGYPELMKELAKANG